MLSEVLDCIHGGPVEDVTSIPTILSGVVIVAPGIVLTSIVEARLLALVPDLSRHAMTTSGAARKAGEHVFTQRIAAVL